jgi:hypothetical protein
MRRGGIACGEVGLHAERWDCMRRGGIAWGKWGGMRMQPPRATLVIVTCHVGDCHLIATLVIVTCHVGDCYLIANLVIVTCHLVIATCHSLHLGALRRQKILGLVFHGGSVAGIGGAFVIVLHGSSSIDGHSPSQPLGNSPSERCLNRKARTQGCAHGDIVVISW